MSRGMEFGEAWFAASAGAAEFGIFAAVVLVLFAFAVWIVREAQR